MRPWSRGVRSPAARREPRVARNAAGARLTRGEAIASGLRMRTAGCDQLPEQGGRPRCIAARGQQGTLAAARHVPAGGRPCPVPGTIRNDGVPAAAPGRSWARSAIRAAPASIQGRGSLALGGGTGAGPALLGRTGAMFRTVASGRAVRRFRRGARGPLPVEPEVRSGRSSIAGPVGGPDDDAGVDPGDDIHEGRGPGVVLVVGHDDRGSGQVVVVGEPGDVGAGEGGGPLAVLTVGAMREDLNDNSLGRAGDP